MNLTVLCTHVPLCLGCRPIGFIQQELHCVIWMRMPCKPFPVPPLFCISRHEASEREQQEKYRGHHCDRPSLELSRIPDPGRGAVGGVELVWADLSVGGAYSPPPNTKRMKTLPSLVFFLLLAACALSPSRGVPATLVLLHDAVNTVSKIIIWNS